MEEIEAKFLNIDKQAFEEKLVLLGAVKVGDYEYRRKIFELPNGGLGKGAFIRLRDDGTKVTFTYKQRFGITSDSLRDGGMNEIETTIGDFETGTQILLAMGLEEVIYKENRRTRYILDGVELDIDSWPLIPPYLEVEGKSWEEVEAVSKKLGLDWSDHVRGMNSEIYETYGIDEQSYSVFTFDRQIKK